MKHHKPLHWIIFVATAILFLVGCSGTQVELPTTTVPPTEVSDEGTSAGEPTATSEPTPTLEPTPAESETGEIIDLGTLGGELSAAHEINDQGQIVGWSVTETGETHAFLWEDGTMIDLGTLGGDFSTANDINNQGQI